MEMVDTKSLISRQHLLWKADRMVDFGRQHEIVELLYSADEGRPDVDPVVLSKIVLHQEEFIEADDGTDIALNH